jgi:hypothetical protein
MKSGYFHRLRRLCWRQLLPTLLCVLPLPALAWDAVGHRLTAAVALEFISDSRRDQLLEILAAHPRYQQDFLEQIPAFVDQADRNALAQWLLGQAAYWPDIARGLPAAARQQYNRPPWHYTDGAWVRGAAAFQGNQYINTDPFPDIQGEAASRIDREADAHNVVTALDYNARLLSDAGTNPAARAVALCWVLHLIGDIHQPLHTGSMFSDNLLSGGDLGGNRIPVGDSNLHAEWDSALREFGVADSLPVILQQLSGFSSPRIEGIESDWTAWMSESRQILTSQVYTPAMKQAIAAADASGAEELDSLELDANYRNQMQRLSRIRLGLAGLRTAIFFENELP